MTGAFAEDWPPSYYPPNLDNWTTGETKNDYVHEAFIILNIPEEHRMDTYLTAFLTCWLCAFALPLRDLGCIRPSALNPHRNLLVDGGFLLLYLHHMEVHDFIGAPMIEFHRANAVRTLARKEAKSFICSGQVINWVIISPNDSYTSWWKSIYSSSVNSLNLPSPLKSSEGSKSQKRKVDITSSHHKDVKATRDSYGKSHLKIRLTRGSSTCSPKEPAVQSTKDEEQKMSFAPVCQELIDVMDDPMTICAATCIIEETSDIVHDVPSTSVGTPSFSTRDIISTTERYENNEFKELFDYINAKNINVLRLQEHVTNYIHAAHSQKKDEEQIQLQQESELSSLLASSKGSLRKHVTIVKDLTYPHTSLEKDITIAEEAMAKLEEANKGLRMLMIHCSPSSGSRRKEAGLLYVATWGYNEAREPNLWSSSCLLSKDCQRLSS
ncbi:Protein SOGA1 [Bienertia sinuspersici]